MQRTYKALIINDFKHAHYAQWVKEGKKKIETRVNRKFKHRGDIVICCGAANSVTDNAGLALCIVEVFEVDWMKPEEETAACVSFHEKRVSYHLRNWRHFSQDFEFKKLKVSGNWQGIFELQIPEGIEIIPKPEILPYKPLVVA
jgi:hypothetical protein